MAARGIVMLAVGLAFVAMSATSLAVPGAGFGDVDEAAREAVASGEIPGVVVLVGQGDQTVLHQAWGWRSLVPEPDEMTTDTIFDVASLTKPLGTAIAVMALVERGEIKLEAPLGRYLREFRSSAFDGVTIERILGHTAGFPALPPSDALVGGFPAAARALAHRPLDYPP
ncbi:MAG: serine hydrolase domain-containing protein, partial [Candidatus Rokuibacteriota bacterium]